MLEDEVSGNEAARGLIRSVLKELDRLNDIVSEYLQFSRFPKPHLKYGHVDGMIRELAAGSNLPNASPCALTLPNPHQKSGWTRTAAPGVG
jgi:hypothetical protein